MKLSKLLETNIDPTKEKELTSLFSSIQRYAHEASVYQNDTASYKGFYHRIKIRMDKIESILRNA